MTCPASPPGDPEMLLFRIAYAAVSVFAPLLRDEERETALAELRAAVRPVLEMHLAKVGQ